MADQAGERLRLVARAIAADLYNRQLGVVVEDRLRHLAEEAERRDTAVEECFRRFRWIRLDKRYVRMW